MEGDITALAVDCIVSNDDVEGRMWASVASAIKAAAGTDVERQSVAGGPYLLGKAWQTDGGQIENTRIIHVASMDRRGRQGGIHTIRQAVSSALTLAREEQLRSLALAAIGSGPQAVGLDSWLHEVSDEIIRYFHNPPPLSPPPAGGDWTDSIAVLLVLFEPDDFSECVAQLRIAITATEASLLEQGRTNAYPRLREAVRRHEARRASIGDVLDATRAMTIQPIGKPRLPVVAALANLDVCLARAELWQDQGDVTTRGDPVAEALRLTDGLFGGAPFPAREISVGSTSFERLPDVAASWLGVDPIRAHGDNTDALRESLDEVLVDLGEVALQVARDGAAVWTNDLDDDAEPLVALLPDGVLGTAKWAGNYGAGLVIEAARKIATHLLGMPLADNAEAELRKLIGSRLPDLTTVSDQNGYARALGTEEAIARTRLAQGDGDGSLVATRAPEVADAVNAAIGPYLVGAAALRHFLVRVSEVSRLLPSEERVACSAAAVLAVASVLIGGREDYDERDSGPAGCVASAVERVLCVSGTERRARHGRPWKR